MKTWAFWASVVWFGTWAGLQTYYLTQELLACMPLPRLW